MSSWHHSLRTLSALPAVQAKVEEPKTHEKVETLSAEEKATCKALGLSHEDMLEQKAHAEKENK